MSDTLRTLLDQAYDQHGADPTRFATAFRDAAPTFTADATGGEAIRMAEHLWVGHLADAAGLAALLDALPADVAGCTDVAPSVTRARWVIATLSGAVPGPLADVDRWRGLQNVGLALAARGAPLRTLEMLLAEEDAAAASPDVAARKAYAAAANNIAVDMRLGPRGDADRDALMLGMAALSRRAWERAGNWMNVERAEYQLAMCHAVLGDGARALPHARLCVAACEAEQADEAERFFAYECLAHAQHAAGEDPAASIATMEALLATITDEGMRSWCAESLAKVPRA